MEIKGGKLWMQLQELGIESAIVQDAFEGKVFILRYKGATTQVTIRDWVRSWQDNAQNADEFILRKAKEFIAATKAEVAMSEEVVTLPRLSDRSLEELVIAITKLETVEGLKVQIPLRWVLTPQVLAQLPKGMGEF